MNDKQAHPSFTTAWDWCDTGTSANLSAEHAGIEAVNMLQLPICKYFLNLHVLLQAEAETKTETSTGLQAVAYQDIAAQTEALLHACSQQGSANT